MDLQSFLYRLKKLKVNRKDGMAPHKPLLLLAVIDGIESGQINTNKIFITPDLVAAFKDNFCRFVTNTRFHPNFSLPFYHLKSDGFWHLQLLPGSEILLTSSASIRSFSALRHAVAYAYLNNDVYKLLQIPVNRTLAKITLITTFFDSQQLAVPYNGLINKVEQQILHEPPTIYRLEVADADEEEQFLRNSIFKRIIPRNYNYTCCISGMQISASREVQMIDACHIVPFSFSHDDTISNGLSLCPNLHRAFDRFLVTIDEKYKVVVSEDFNESNTYSIKAFHDKSIILPEKKEYWPSVENLRWHNEKFYQFNK